MSWDRHHSRSESLAAEAGIARRTGNSTQAEELYRQAAAAEREALDSVPGDKQRTWGITAVSAVALWYKGREYKIAEQLAYRCLALEQIPSFAEAQLRDLLQVIWTAYAAEQTGVRFVPGDVLVSVKGGQVIHGGAPLDLIVRKVEGIQAVLFRTVEMLLDRPFRKHGGPPLDVQSMFKPWLFQAPAGSYQFAVRVQEPEQQGLYADARPKVERVTATFFQVLQATAGNPETDLPTLVQDPLYRGAFLSLSRNLAPTGKTFERLEVRDASAPTEPVASFALETRQLINAALRKAKPARAMAFSDEAATIEGTLRAVHLDEDWLEVATNDLPPNHIRVDEASDALDDVVGPMVNHKVVVTAVRRGAKYLYRDIELEE
ncbi:MAG: hypothetical protein HY281_10110 [Nitrospirae bacterium]|nr:hypothetical protein [Nitrospirota bacterium]